VLSQHNAMLGGFLKTSSMPLADCFLLLAIGAIPLLVLELLKVFRQKVPSKRDPDETIKKHVLHDDTAH
jgi:Ca2+-transporting ATPase